MRLDKYIADNLPFSRQQVRALLRRGRVTVNSQKAVLPTHKLGPGDQVHLDGTRINPIGLQYWMVHKPAGYVSATKDAEHPVVRDLVPLQDADLHIAGRLDRDVTGLVILTNDGAWSHRLTSPRSDCTKRYRFRSQEPIPEGTEALFAQGVWLRNETRITKPATLVLEDPHQGTLQISEGRYHQVKRMFYSQGCKLLALHREAIGSIELDIEPGQARPLSAAEIASI